MVGEKNLVPTPTLLSNSEIRLNVCFLYVFLSAACLQYFMRERERERENE